MGDDWSRYPFELVPGDPQFRFPAAEANHQDCESDTWFVAGELTGDSGRNFAFLTIFNKNRPGQSIVADFYTFALFDLDSGTYATYTDYDMPSANRHSGADPKLSVANDHLDMTYESQAGTAVWRTSRDERDELVPYTYDVELVGTDQAGQTHAPGPACDAVEGASAIGGVGVQRQDRVLRPSRHVLLLPDPDGDDRHAAVGGHRRKSSPGPWDMSTGNGSRLSPIAVERTAIYVPGRHEWRTINLNNGIDLSIWRQFDRANGNALQPFSGATTSSPDSDPEFADDIEVEVASYVRWPESVRTLVPPPAEARYMPDRHRLTSRKLDLDLTGEPLVAAPAHALPIEYMEGPYHYRGTFRGQPVSGFAFYERSLALYRDWELADDRSTSQV